MSGVADQIVGLLDASSEDVARDWTAHINPMFVEALELMGFRRDIVRGEGTRLWDANGREYLDFLAGYGSVPLGHNHPEIRATLEAVLQAPLPHFILVSIEPLAAALAAKLAALAPGDLDVAFLCSSGSEGVEGALKLAKAATRRPRFVSAERGYHGTTLGALSITDCRQHRGPFEPLLPGCATVPWGNADAIERELKKRDVAAVVLEPIQAEAGVRLPPPGYLLEVSRLCRRYGALFILDEVQTGIGRTGTLFAYEQEDVEPDVVVLAKGLSGGLVPVGAYLTRRDLWKRAYGDLQRYDIHCSTFRGGPLACAAALATLQIVERDDLAARAATIGEHLGGRLREVCADHPLVRDVRGRGLLWGVELDTPERGVTADLVGQWLVTGLLERGALTQVCTLAKSVVRAEPSLVIEHADVDRFAEALRGTLAVHATGKWRSLAGVAGRVAGRAISKQAQRLRGTPS